MLLFGKIETSANDRLILRNTRTQVMQVKGRIQTQQKVPTQTSSSSISLHIYTVYNLSKERVVNDEESNNNHSNYHRNLLLYIMAEPKGPSPQNSQTPQKPETPTNHASLHATALESSLARLSLSTQSSKATASKKKQSQPADSWEDEANNSSGEESSQPPQPADFPDAPPPTPASPTAFKNQMFTNPYGYSADGSSDARTERLRRPEKTDAVAKRMIAGALGVKAPKKTEEQKAYDRAIKEKEIKRRNAEKEEKKREEEMAEKAKAAIWED
ncbi:hypothetical protein HYFRA_00012914 [Hymenoscyphus fraxineus]|uniref:Uncharacterized protein n=1 Tax=Hymenoscyphus fraxineus TaxID=746836 RepID=A0A9N9L8I2_9HELO|nr:hypothetical protein HYFRA_00012914 [Hymenoscyphus fraxineus]